MDAGDDASAEKALAMEQRMKDLEAQILRCKSYG